MFLILANLKEKRISLMSGNRTTLPFGPIRANDPAEVAKTLAKRI
jgi:hypothetical protein